MTLTDRIKKQETLQAEAREKSQAAKADVKRLSELADELQRRIDRQKRKRQQSNATDLERERRAEKIEELEADLDRVVERLDDAKEDHKDAAKARRKHAKRVARLRRKRAEMAEDQAGQFTKDFHVAEFHCRDGTPVPSAIVPHLRDLCEKHLQPLRDSGGSVHINSGYRTRSYNAAIGGATQSYHIYDLRMKAPAADHIQSGRSATAVQQWHDAHNPPDGMGYYAGFTHIDDRGYRSRWWGAA